MRAARIVPDPRAPCLIVDYRTASRFLKNKRQKFFRNRENDVEYFREKSDYP